MVAVDSLANSVAALVADDALEDRLAGACARLAEGHDDAGDDERGQELQQAAADAGHHAPAPLRQLADLRLQALDSAGRSVCACDQKAWTFLPTTGHSATLAARRRESRSVFSCTPSISSMHRVAQRTHQHRRRRDDQHDAEQDDQRRRQPCLPPIRRASIWCTG